MSKVLNQVKLNATLTLSECTDGFWLYDTTRGRNLAMRVKNKDDAFIEALEYYQKRLKEHENALKALQTKVECFVSLFVHEVEYGSSTDIPDTVLEVVI